MIFYILLDITYDLLDRILSSVEVVFVNYNQENYWLSNCRSWVLIYSDAACSSFTLLLLAFELARMVHVKSFFIALLRFSELLDFWFEWLRLATFLLLSFGVSIYRRCHTVRSLWFCLLTSDGLCWLQFICRCPRLFSSTLMLLLLEVSCFTR